MNDKNVLIEGGIDVDKSLELLGDMSIYDETLSDFLNQIGEKFAKLKAAKDANDVENYTIYVHSLKSDGRYLGFTKFADMALAHEMESKEGNLNYANEHFNELVTELNRVIEVAKKYLVVKPIVEIPDETDVQAPKNDSILIVDDSDLIRNFIYKIFNNRFEVIMADDGDKAIELIDADKENNKIKGVFLDLNMPNVNGFEVLNYLNDNNLFAKYPVSIISGNCDQEAIDKAFKYPIIDMLSKPFTESDVTRIVERTISHN